MTLEADRSAEVARVRRATRSIDVSWASALVVDDVEENRDLLVRRLRRLGVTDIGQAANGREALERLGERDYDLVLLDIMMPEMNGYEVLDVLSAEITSTGRSWVRPSALSTSRTS